MSIAIAIALHVLSAAVWVGGMFFAYMCLRPVAAELLEPPQRLRLWAKVFARFFPWVWAAVVLLLISGYWMIFGRFGGFASAPLYVHLMQGLGLVMAGIYLYVFFAPYGRLRRAVAVEDWPAGGEALGRIRRLVGLNTVLGLLTIAAATAGRYLIPV